ncbi:uncharacterized protein LOC111373563 [Olea europaea var. sylvestris]|uniref:uncharacterized protein LOC111373563 n=1 Tax=Olea europaea var. sylvestris TaxID=158386 RepID=UPI000C1CF5D7|nr:uncharacterized protein LOC111373563 [Olea europaea var. sylvestris]
MVHKYAFEALDKMLRDITECQLPSGGKVIVCGGFRQVLPVVQRGTKDDIMKAKITGEKVTYFSFDEVIDKNEGFIDEVFLNNLAPNVMLLKNINPAEGLCNGTRFICSDFKHNVILAEIGIGEYREKQVFLPRIPFIPLEGDKQLNLYFPMANYCVAVRYCVVLNTNTIGEADI